MSLLGGEGRRGEMGQGGGGREEGRGVGMGKVTKYSKNA